MNNEQKKEYTAPKMEIIDYKLEGILLQCSGEGCVKTTWDKTEP